MRVAILGPVSPGDLSEFLWPRERPRAATLTGYGAALAPLIAGLLRAGHEVLAITHRRGHGANVFQGDRLRVIQVASRGSGARQALDAFAYERLQMAAALQGQKVDVVHVHWAYEWALAARSTRTPLLVTVHDAPLSVLRRDMGAYRLLRTLLAYRVRFSMRAATYSAVSAHLASRWQRQMLYSREIAVIPNAVPRIAPSEIRSRHPSIVEVADASRLKNVAVLVRAMPEILRQVPDARLAIYGPGLDSRSALAASARQSRLERHVTFYGPVAPSVIRGAMRRAWVHCHVSLEESFGLTLVEAMGSGAAIVAGARSGAVPETLAACPSAALVDVSSPQAVAGAVASLLLDSERRARAEREGIRAARQYEADVVAQQYLRVYERLVAADARRR